MPIDEELLKPSREHLADLGVMIRKAENEAMDAVERWGQDDPEYAKRRCNEFYRSVEPLRQEQEAVIKLIADYYGMQAVPPIVMLPE